MPQSDDATAIVRDLIAAGVDPSLIARVSVLAARVSDLDRRRATDADRQRRSREARHASHVTSRDTSDVTPRAYTFPPKKIEPKKVLSMQIPSDLVMSEANLAFAKSKGLSDEGARAQFERFRDHFLASGARKRDWDAVWRNWVTSPYQQTRQSNGHHHAPRPGSKEDQRERTAEAYRQLSDYVDAHADESRRGRKPRPADAGFLPFAKPS